MAELWSTSREALLHGGAVPPAFGSFETVVEARYLASETLPSGDGDCEFRFVGHIKGLSGGTSTLRIKLGGSDSDLLGTTLLTVSVGANGIVSGVATFARGLLTGGPLPLKITGIHAGGGTGAALEAFVLSIAGVFVAPVPGPAPGPPELIGTDEADFGVDIDVLTDLPSDFRLVSGRRNLAQALARRFDTPQGWLHRAFGGDPNYGSDLREKLNGRWTSEQLARAATEVEAQCREDERVQSAEVSVEHDLATSTLDVNIELETAAGPFSLTLRVSQVSVEVLRVE